MTLKAAFIGLGAMGAPMARHLKAKGLLHAVANRTQTKALQLAQELDVTAPATLAELAAQCDVIALCVTADADVLNTVEALAPHLQPGAIVIDHSTDAPATAKRAAAMLAAVGAHFLDAPVSGGVEGAKNGKLSVMVGGDAAVLERARPVLEAYALRVTHLGDVGAGQATKAINQILVAGIAQAVRRPRAGRGARPRSGAADPHPGRRCRGQLVPRQARRDDAA
jgi:3-hydroxyisobutyrate dehydrogenase